MSEEIENKAENLDTQESAGEPYPEKTTVEPIQTKAETPSEEKSEEEETTAE